MWVRSSNAFYGIFNLHMDRSPGFGSAHTDFIALLRLGLPAAPELNSLTSPVCTTRRTVLQKYAVARGRCLQQTSACLALPKITRRPRFARSASCFPVSPSCARFSSHICADFRFLQPCSCKHGNAASSENSLQTTSIMLRQFVNTGFQVLFHSPPGVLFTFPSQYYALSVTK